VFGEELAAWHHDDNAPNIWVNLTNLGWFGDARTSPAHVQFLAMSQARAMELARPMIVATNTGISAYITPDGVVAQDLPAQKEAVGNWSVQPYDGQTPFIAWRNVPLFLLLIVFGGWLYWGKLRQRRSAAEFHFK
jgi:apolipoprotein N-acyltransferase